MLLSPARCQACTWPELDSLMVGDFVRRQRNLIGPRLVATLVHNTGYEKPTTEAQLLYLPDIDGPSEAPAGSAQAVDARQGYEDAEKRAFLIRMVKRVRPNRLEWAPEPGSPGALELEAARQQWAAEESAPAAEPVAVLTP